MSQHPKPRRPTGQVSCPTCGQRFEAAQTSSMPFCSPRCRQIDLGRWLEEEYGLPIERESADDYQGALELPDD